MLAPLTPRMAHALLSPSARVLVAAALPASLATLAVDDLPWDAVHWPTLLSLMAYERAEAPVCRLLHRVPERVPDDVRTTAKRLERVAQFQAAELHDAAAAVVDALAAAAVPALWLKGAALAMQSPEGFGLRSMGDLDLLVLGSDAARARAVLTTAGWFTPGAHGYDVHHHDPPMMRPGGLRLELHTALFPQQHPFTDETTDVWLRRGTEIAWGTRRVLVLPAHWHVVHASTHWAWSHEGTVGSWQYLHDMHRLTAGWSADGVEWDAVVRSAEAFGASIPVGWGVWTAQRLAGLASSHRVVHRLRGGLGALGGVVEREWVLAVLHSPAGSPSVRWSRFWWRRAMQGLGDDGGRWPWRAGRGGQVQLMAPVALPSGGATPARWSRWRRHLVRLLRS